MLGLELPPTRDFHRAVTGFLASETGIKADCNWKMHLLLELVPTKGHA